MKKLVLIALVLGLPGISQAKTLEDLLVEKGVITAGEARGTVDSADAKVYWNNGTMLEFPDNGFTTRINTEIRSRYTYEDVNNGFTDSSNFSQNKARITMSGTALYKEFNYKLQADLNKGDSSKVKEAYIEWQPCEGMGYRMGRMDTLVARQYAAGNYAKQIPDDSIATQAFATGTQGGIRAFYSDLDDTYNLSASLYNGDSDDEGDYGARSYDDKGGTDTKHAYEAAARVNVLGHMNAYNEGDIDFTDDLALNIGAAYSYSEGDNLFGDVGDVITAKTHRVSADANLKVQGFAFHTEFFWADYDDKYVDEDINPVGFYAQAGYFVTPDFEIAGRYSFVDYDGWTAMAPYGITDDANEVAVSLNYYFWKHNLKAQLAYIFVNNDLPSNYKDSFEDDEINSNRWMFQVSAYL